MYQVTIRGPDGSEVQYALNADEGLIVGRDETCDVVLPSKRVSRRHARFFTQGELLNVEDLGSQNGVFVGGARIQGTQEIRPGPAIEIGEFKIRIKRQDPRALKAVGEIDVNQAVEAHLKGLGDMAGKSIKLPTEKGFVGRDATMEVHIDNDSVSRKHAEIRVEAGTVFMVKDLGSSNGTFVNGNRLKHGLDARIKPGDKVRFGETHWQFLGGPAAGGGGLNERTRRLLLVGFALLALFVSAAVIKKLLAPPQVAVDEGGLTVDEQLAEALGRGQALMEQDKFEDARDAFEEALRSDPVNTEARLLLRKAEREVEHGRLFREAQTKFEVGNDKEGLDLVTQIDSQSRYFARARLKVQEIAQAMMKKDGPECRRAGQRQRWSEAVERCSRYLDFRCHGQMDEEAEKYLRQAERATRAKSAWVCPARYAPWFGSGQTTNNHEKELSVLYPGKELRDAVLKYVGGDIAEAQKLAQKLRSGKEGARASEVYEALVLIEGRFKEGQSALNRGVLREAEGAFRMAIDADTKLLRGTQVQSFSGRQMRTALGKQYFDIGKGLFDRSRWTEAYDAWAKGIEYNGNDSSLLDGMARLEKVAEGILANGANCDQLQVASHITRTSSPVHSRAASALAEECR